MYLLVKKANEAFGRIWEDLGGFEMNLFGFEASLANAQCTEPNAQCLPDAQRQCIFTQEKVA